LWNGGVVLGKFQELEDTYKNYIMRIIVNLGHKEFHSAGIHLPQMLYIWPYFAFFSWPLLLILLFNLITPSAYLPKFLDSGLADKQKFPRILPMIIIIAFMLLAVHFNTIVHPFTLADNRHYVFYIFRILLRYHPAVKYAVTPIYFICAWAILTQLGFSGSLEAQTPPIDSSLIYRSAVDTEKREVEANRKSPREAPPVLKPEIVSEVQENEQRQLHVSFVLVWLISTSLSVITAPLVEPRYFIIPWVMWRLHLPQQPIRRRAPYTMESFTAACITNFPRLLETVWFVVVNSITCYVFLFKGFEWPQEPGKVQRFMW
jgi:alpha-1,2-glucosyltransferase